MKKALRNSLLIATLFIGVNSYSQNSILLLLPYDTDTIETKNPLLTWSYLGGIPYTNSREYYSLVLVELEDNQSAASGVIVNTPLIKIDQLQGTQLFYPYDAPELEEGKRYGWQIQKIENQVKTDQSEAWEFYIPLPELPEYQKYAMLKKSFDGVPYIAKEGKLFFTMHEPYEPSSLSIQIFNESHQMVQKNIVQDGHDESIEAQEEEFKIKKTGTNYFQVDLGSNLASGIYELNIQDTKKQKYLLKFIIE
jgi:hypothetical protein